MGNYCSLRIRPHSTVSATLVRWLALLSCCIAFSSCSSLGPQPPYNPATEEGQHQATVRISGVSCRDCVVRIALFDYPQHWLRHQQTYRGRLVLISDNVSTLTFYGLPAGEYAAAAFVDRNNNGRLDRWLGLIPREPVAYSLVRERRLPPSFEESAFIVPTSLKRAIPVHFGRSRSQ